LVVTQSPREIGIDPNFEAFVRLAGMASSPLKMVNGQAASLGRRREFGHKTQNFSASRFSESRGKNDLMEVEESVPLKGGADGSTTDQCDREVDSGKSSFGNECEGCCEAVQCQTGRSTKAFPSVPSSIPFEFLEPGEGIPDGKSGQGTIAVIQGNSGCGRIRQSAERISSVQAAAWDDV
jgi:hypothetical protein